jgi:hypothetical protein
MPEYAPPSDFPKEEIPPGFDAFFYWSYLENSPITSIFATNQLFSLFAGGPQGHEKFI